MAVISVPKTTFVLTAEPQAISNAPQRILFLGQQITDTSVDAELIKNIQPNGQEDSLFGRKSMLASMIRGFRTINTVSQVDAIPLNDNGSSVAASSIVTFAGTATASGTIVFYIQSKILFTFQIAVSVGDTAEVVATSLTNLVNANDTILVTATDNLDDTVTLEASFDGEVGNDISLEFSGTVAGITTSIVTFAGGLLNPDISTVLDQVGDIRYQTIVYPAQYDKSVISTFLDARFNSTNSIEDGLGITHETNDVATLEAEADSLDSASMLLLGTKPVSKTTYQGSALFEFDPVAASYGAALRTIRLTSGANISNILVGGVGSGNSFGGAWLAAVPYHNTPVSNVSVIETELGWSKSEQDQLNAAGVAFFGNNISRNEVIFGDMVTTYLNNAQGIPDTSFKYLNTVDTGSQIREYFYNNNKSEYAQAVLTAGDVVPLSKQVNIDSFNAFQVALYVTLTQQPYALTVAGSNAINFFKQNITTTVDFSTGTISTVMIVPIVTQVREINGTIEIAFDITTS